MALSRKRVIVRGIVQGVGFRPFVYRVALDLGLKGWVENSPQGAIIDLEGDDSQIQSLVQAIREDLPAPGEVKSIEEKELPWFGHKTFEIRKSSADGDVEALILPDIATCNACLQEVFDPANSRYRYPFTNCTHCGPRFTIIRSLPYDRGSTTMEKFKMCSECQREYDDPLDRRFHAQPNACPECGPQLEYWNLAGEPQAEKDEALQMATDLLRKGDILAIKGLGGFHLMVDATNKEAVANLREIKCREEKAMAIMCPDMRWVEKVAMLKPVERELLESPQAPITLLEKNKEVLPENIAPQNAFLGIMLPYTPLHHLLLKDFGNPVVATSGNRTDEPICFDEKEAVERLGDIAQGFLVHDRPIQRYVDDSIARVMGDRKVMIRRARGYAPLPVAKMPGLKDGILGMGAHLKSTIAFSKNESIFLSHHIGDLETEAAVKGFDQILEDFPKLYALKPTLVIHDLHPDYYSSQRTADLNLPTRGLQHHRAHVYACMAENHVFEDLLAFSWDGTGLGEDQTIWGGEIFRFSNNRLHHLASMRRFYLLGGDRAAREPRRSALGMLFEAFGASFFEKSYLPTLKAFDAKELSVFRDLLRAERQGVWTSSMGRFFDGIASLLGVSQSCSYEAQAAIQLEQLALGDSDESFYSFKLSLEKEPIRINWEPLLLDLISDFAKNTSQARMARKFHNTLVEIMVSLAKLEEVKNILLTGGCFQNRLLTETAIQRLELEGFKVHTHHEIPPNDGGIAVGQLASQALLTRGRGSSTDL